MYKSKRSLKVYEAPLGLNDKQQIPRIQLQGQWLEAIGYHVGDKTKDFTFQLKMTGNTPAELPYTKGTETGKLKVTDGVVEFTLSDGESITLGNILIDTTYEITEVDGASNGYAVESTNSSGTLTEDTNVSFTNTRNGTVPTSAHTNILISIGVFAIALAGLFWHLRKRKQQY